MAIKNASAAAAAKFVNDESFLLCDKQGCKNIHAISCCSQCLTAYYCSKECQKSAFKAHKNECELLSQYKQRLIEDRKKIEAKEQEQELAHTHTASTESCAVCLKAMTAEELPLSPLGCGHLFCYFCCLANELEMIVTVADDKNDKNNEEKKPFVCPICNPGMSNSMLIPIFRRKALEFIRLANLCERDGKAVKRYVTQAREELEKTTAGGYWKERNAQDPVIQQLVAELYELDGQYEIAIQTGNTVLASLGAKEASGFVLECQSRTGLLIARCQMNLGLYPDAFDTLQKAADHLSAYDHHATPEDRMNGSAIARTQLQLYYLLSRCYYHKGNHDRSIECAEVAIDMNRHEKGVYEYLVKSYQGKGELKTAVIMMKRAIRYETPWDPRNLEELRKQLGILEEELAAKTKKSVGEK